MITFSPERLVAAASAFVGVGEEGDANSGQMVELFLRGVNQPAGQPWCAAFVHHVGYWSHYDHATRRSSWPLPATASCWQLGEFARVRAVLKPLPQVGDVFLVYSGKLRRFAHTGIVTSLVSHQRAGDDHVVECGTVEGNSNDGGSRDGRMTVSRQRKFSYVNGDRFIHWVDLESRAQAA